jgi:hypothetical protein
LIKCDQTSVTQVGNYMFMNVFFVNYITLSHL